MKLKVPGVLATLLTVMFSSAGTAQPVVAAAATEFKAMDANRDGKVSREEHAAGARGMFEKMDANKDGKVTAAEMDAAHRAIVEAFGVPELIEMASAFYTLHPGDVVFTGTPEGVSPIEPGDEIVATIEQIGTMRVQVRAADAPVTAAAAAASRMA